MVNDDRPPRALSSEPASGRPQREVATSAEQSVPAHVLKLIELVSRASTKPAVWQEFATKLSVELDDAAIALTLELPALPTRLLAYRVHTLPEYTSVFADFVSRVAVVIGSDPLACQEALGPALQMERLHG